MDENGIRGRQETLSDVMMKLKNKQGKTAQHVMHSFLYEKTSNRTTGQHHMDLELINETQFQTNCFFHNV